MGTKVCGWCKRRKPLTEFYKPPNRRTHRSRCRKCECAIAKGRVKEDPDNPYLDIAPFSKWLAALVEEFGVAEAALSTGLSQRRLYCFIQREQDQVKLDTVDAALVSEGGTHLSDLYPELYNEMEEAA
jgi:hypothetical protein